MAGGHRAEGFPSHIEYLKPPRKKKRRMQSPEDSLYKGNHCKQNNEVAYCSVIRCIRNDTCMMKRRIKKQKTISSK